MKERFFYAGDEKVSLTPVSHQMAVQFKPEVEMSTCSETLKGLDDVGEIQQADLFEHFNLALVPTKKGVSSKAINSSLGALASKKEVENVMPVFQIPDGAPEEVMILPQKFRVQFLPDVSKKDIDKLNKKHHVKVIEEEELFPNNYLLEVNADQDALDIANIYHESELTEYAEPDWILMLNKLAPPVVSDTYFTQQWALPKMNVPAAWRINKGNRNIKIAIIDEGVQTNHPDLRYKIVSPYDAFGNDNNQEPNSWDGHGTACAGIAAASTNNNRGVAGVAPNCKILPVRIAQGFPNRPGWITNATIIARGIITATNRGADILSNSWGGGPYNNTIRNAFKHAVRNGRSGKGCVVISASGNDNVRSVSYPARYPESLACGASDKIDNRKSPSSPDGEHWWGSNYGPGLDFIAPGVLIYTTDITGTGGYSPSSYINRFNGTSSATPNAAGVAALILSVDRNLRQWEVRDILRLSAKNLGPSGWDEQTGWGRVDALKALIAARKLWYSTHLSLSFLGRGKECYMRFKKFRLYNSGINRVRLNSFKIRSFDPLGRVIDKFEYVANPGGIMNPGLVAGGGSGHDVVFKDILLKANGNRYSYSYRWHASWSFTYWRPSSAKTSPAHTMETLQPTVEYLDYDEQEFEVSMEGPGNKQVPLDITFDEPGASDESQEVIQNGQSNGVYTTNKNGVKITVQVE